MDEKLITDRFKSWSSVNYAPQIANAKYIWLCDHFYLVNFHSWSKVAVTFSSLEDSLVIGLLKCGLLKINCCCCCHKINAILTFNSVERQLSTRDHPNELDQARRSERRWDLVGYSLKNFGLKFRKVDWIKMLRNCKVQGTYRVGILCVFIRREHCKCHLHGFVNVPGLKEVVQFSLGFHHTRSIGWCNLMTQSFNEIQEFFVRLIRKVVSWCAH